LIEWCVRLTDIAQRKLTTFYGQEDRATLQNVLHNVPNVVPHLLRLASSPDNNHTATGSPAADTASANFTQMLTKLRPNITVR